MAAHIHKGAMDASGPPVVTLTPPENGKSEGCVHVERMAAADILARPQDYYVNIHTKDFPGGAIRGQLK